MEKKGVSVGFFHLLVVRHAPTDMLVVYECLCPLFTQAPSPFPLGRGKGGLAGVVVVGERGGRMKDRKQGDRGNMHAIHLPTRNSWLTLEVSRQADWSGEMRARGQLSSCSSSSPRCLRKRGPAALMVITISGRTMVWW